MLDIGWPELLVISVVMIVVVGPKDLPKMLRAFGKATAKLRATASEFRTHFDDAMREAELDEVKKTIDGVKQYDPRKTVTDIFEPVRSAGDDLRNSLNNSSPKPDEAPAVPMDSPLDLSDIKEDEVKAASLPQPAASKPVAAPPVTEPVQKENADPAVKPAVKPASKVTAKAKSASKVTAKAKPASKVTAKAVPAEAKVTAPKKAATPRAKPAVKTTKKTGTEQ